MVRDYFSVFSKDDSAYLLRIHQKVDFADEIAWAHCWFCNKNTFPSLIAPLVVDYLINGFDFIENWERLDEKGWHENVYHLGFRKELIETELVPKIICQKGEFPLLIATMLKEKFVAKIPEEIPTRVGSLTTALCNKGFPAPTPRDPEATINIPIKDVISKNWAKLNKDLEVFA